ncbi:hypothetical protein AeNC1_011808 [Aphanomyces euteiches]|nr:hypothetical protein AeNC1_011808 [Aphanomyces euteiches]
MLDAEQVAQINLPSDVPGDTVQLMASNVEEEGMLSFLVKTDKACLLVQDKTLLPLSCDGPSSSLSSDGMVICGWTSGKTLNVYYGGEMIVSRLLDLPSSVWQSYVIKSRVASASLYEFILIVITIDGSIHRVRIQAAHETIQLLAEVSQSHPTLTTSALHGDLLVLAGGIRSSDRGMEQGSTLSLWNLTDTSAELLHYSTVLSQVSAEPTEQSSWWSSMLSPEQLYPGTIQELSISPGGAYVALLDKSGHISIRQVDTCATLVDWTLVHSVKATSLGWFHPNQLVVASSAANTPIVCEIIDDKLSIPELEDSSHPRDDDSTLSSNVLATPTNGVFFHLRGSNSNLEIVMFREVPVDIVYSKLLSQYRFDEALALATAHNDKLDVDVVHKAVWLHHVGVGTATEALDSLIADHLTHVHDKTWIIETAKRTILDSPGTCSRLWTFALSKDDDAALRQLLDRLETFVSLIQGNKAAEGLSSEFFEPSAFEEFLAMPWLDIALGFAHEGRVRDLTILFDRHGYHLLPHKCTILSVLPASLPPRDFQHLLPCIPPSLQDDSDLLYYVLDAISDGFVAATLRDAPDVTPQVIHEYNAQPSIEQRRKTICDWFVARSYEMDSMFGLLEDAQTLIQLSRRCVGDAHGHEELAKLYREFEELHLFVYDFEVTPMWTIQAWQHANSVKPSHKLELVIQSNQSKAQVLELLRRDMIRQEELAAAITALDLTNFDAFAWAADILAASSPISTERYIRDNRILVETALFCCFGFDLADTDRPQYFIECAWAIFQTLPKVLPDEKLQTEADALEHYMTAMEILASYNCFQSPVSLRQRAGESTFFTSLVDQCCATVTSEAQYEKLLDDMLLVRDHAFPAAITTDDAIASVCQCLLAHASSPSLILRQLCPSPTILLEAAKAHFHSATSTSSPSIALALTYLAWIEDTVECNYASLLYATQWLEQCKGEPIAPATIIALSNADRLAYVQDLLVNRSQHCINHLDQLAEVAQWLDLTPKLPWMQVWAAYAYLQSRHVDRAIALTISILTQASIQDDGFSAQLASLTLDLVSLSGHYNARHQLCSTALFSIQDNGTSMVLLDWAKKLDAIVQSLVVLQLSEDEVAAEKDSQVSDYVWFSEQLVVHQEVVSSQPDLLCKSLIASIHLDLAFEFHLPTATTDVVRSGPSLLSRLGQLAKIYLDRMDIAMTKGYLCRLSATQAFNIWSSACARAEPANQVVLAQHAQLYFKDDATKVQHFASLQVSSKQEADLDLLQQILPSFDRSRFDVDHIYRYDMLVQLMATQRWQEAANICAKFQINLWELHVQFLEMLLTRPGVESREEELKKAQLPLPTEGMSLLQHAMTQPSALSQRFLKSTAQRLDPFDSIAWEYLWWVCLECFKRDPNAVDLPAERLKLYCACANKLRKSDIRVHLPHFCSSDLSLVVASVVPILSGATIRVMALMLKKLHGLPPSTIVFIHLDMVLANHVDADKAYETALPFLSTLSTEHLVIVVAKLLSPHAHHEVHGYTIQAPARYAPRLSSAKRVEVVLDIYHMAQARQAPPTDVTFLERQVLWSQLAALIAQAKLQPPVDTFPSPSVLPPFDAQIAAWCCQPVSLAFCRSLLQLTSALDSGKDHQPLFERHIGAMLEAHVLTLTAGDELVKPSPHPLYRYLAAKWAQDQAPPVELRLIPETVVVEPLEGIFCAAVLKWLEDVEPSPSTVVLLSWMNALVPPSVSNAFGSTHASASIVSMLYELDGDGEWKSLQTQVTTDFDNVWNAALLRIADTPAANEGLANVLLKWESHQEQSSSNVSWATELSRVVAHRLELEWEEETNPSPLFSAALWHQLWSRTQWSEEGLNNLLRSNPSAYASLTEEIVQQFVTEGYTIVALLSPFESIHAALMPDAFNFQELTPSHLELLIVRFPLDVLLPIVPWDRMVQVCIHHEAKGGPNALASVLYLVVGFLAEDNLAMTSRILCQVANVHPMVWDTRLLEPLLKRYFESIKSRANSLDAPRQALYEKLEFFV